MIWETIRPAELASWVSAFQKGPAHAAYQLLDAGSTRSAIEGSMWAQIADALMEIHPISGAVDLNFGRLPGFTEEQITSMTLHILNEIDPRPASSWSNLDQEEGPKFLNVLAEAGTEYWLDVDAMKPVGPGGRITFYPRQRLVEIVARRRGPSLGGVWKQPTEIADRTMDFLDIGSAPDARLRGRFGYYEASKYQAQSLLRPVFVFLLDRAPATEGPRWRVAHVQAATSLPDSADSAGIETICGCV